MSRWLSSNEFEIAPEGVTFTCQRPAKGSRLESLYVVRLLDGTYAHSSAPRLNQRAEEWDMFAYGEVPDALCFMEYNANISNGEMFVIETLECERLCRVECCGVAVIACASFQNSGSAYIENFDADLQVCAKDYDGWLDALEVLYTYPPQALDNMS